MVLSGFLLGTLSTAGAYFIYAKMPKRVKQWMLDHPLFVDLSAMILTYLIFGGGATVLFAAAFCCIETSILLALAQDPEIIKLLENLLTYSKEIQQKAIELLKGLMSSLQKQNAQ